MTVTQLIGIYAAGYVVNVLALANLDAASHDPRLPLREVEVDWAFICKISIVWPIVDAFGPPIFLGAWVADKVQERSFWNVRTRIANFLTTPGRLFRERKRKRLELQEYNAYVLKTPVEQIAEKKLLSDG